jgi:hypothetical protein
VIYFSSFLTCDVRKAAAGQEMPGRNAANLSFSKSDDAPP